MAWLECTNAHGLQAECFPSNQMQMGTCVQFIVGGVMIRVMITDDHLIVREGLRLILETADDIEVVGEAVDGAECLGTCFEIKSPGHSDGSCKCRAWTASLPLSHLRKDFPEIAIVILTTYNEDDLMIRGLQSGARGYLLKDSSRESLLDAIHAAAKGETLLKPEILARVLAPQSAPKPASTPKPIPR
jgi:NarL family two-component system response regulator YdfI